MVKRGQEELGKNISSLKPVEGIEAIVEALKNKGFNLGILSSNSKDNLGKFLKQNNLINFFDFIVSENNLFGKTKALNGILKKHKITRGDTYYIGDETRDVEAAQDAGIKSIAVCWGFNTKEILLKSRPDFIVDKPENILLLKL